MFSNKVKHIKAQEAGVILVELAIVILICFLGFDMARATSYDLALKDISRELAVSAQLCAYRAEIPRNACINEHINIIDSIARKNFPGGNGNGASPIKLSFEAYELAPGDTEADQQKNRTDRQAACGNGFNAPKAKMLPVNKIAGIQTQSFNNKKINVQDSEGTVGSLLSDKSHQELLCLNRTLIIAEVEFFYSPVLTFNFYKSGNYTSENSGQSGGGFFSPRNLNSATVL